MMEWQQKAGRALKAWGWGHWCCFRQKLFHVYACAAQPGIFSVGTWVTTVAVEFKVQRMQCGFTLTLLRETRKCSSPTQLEASVSTGDPVALCGLHLRWAVFWRLSENTLTPEPWQWKISKYQDWPLRSNIQPINLSRRRLLSCVKRKGGAANSCAAEVKLARRPTPWSSVS